MIGRSSQGRPKLVGSEECTAAVTESCYWQGARPAEAHEAVLNPSEACPLIRLLVMDGRQLSGDWSERADHEGMLTTLVHRTRDLTTGNSVQVVVSWHRHRLLWFRRKLFIEGL
jgi:hypothetical protein